MGSILREDKIGNFSVGGGFISLDSLLVSIGPRQYYGAGLQVAEPSYTANTLYFIYAVLNPTLNIVVSENVNSVGPAGLSEWKLIGAFYSDGTGSPSFGSFVNIEGEPRTKDSIPYAAVLSWTTNVNLFTSYWQRKGKKITQSLRLQTTGAPDAVALTCDTVFEINETGIYAPTVDQVFGGPSLWTDSSANRRYYIVPTRGTSTVVRFQVWFDDGSYERIRGVSDTVPFIADNLDQLVSNWSYDAVGMSETPLVDL